MHRRQYAPKPAQDTSVLSSEKLLQTRPFHPEIDNNLQAPSMQASVQPMTGGFDLTKKVFVDEPQRPQPAGPLLQAKLTIGEPNDKYEQEADRVAHDVVQRIHDPGGINATHSDQSQTASLVANPLHPLQRIAMREDKERLQKKAIANMQRFAAGAATAPTEVEQVINSARGSGQSLVPKLQAQMEQAMGVDFSGVRVHVDARADQLNRSVGARAFTTGQDIYFQQGAYVPESREGQELIAHELTHVVQQNGGQMAAQHNAVITPSNVAVQRKVKVHLDSDFHSAALKQTIVSLDVTKMPTVKAAAMKEVLKRQGTKRGGGDLLSTTRNSLDTNTGISTRHVIPEQSYRDELTHRLRGSTLGEAREWLNQALGIQRNDPNVRVDIQNKADAWLEQRINDPTDIFLGTTQENQSRGENYDDPQTADSGTAFTNEEKYRISAYYFLGETPRAFGDENKTSLYHRVNEKLSQLGYMQNHTEEFLIHQYYAQAQASYYKTPQEKNIRDMQWKNPLSPEIQKENAHILTNMELKIKLAVQQVMSQVAAHIQVNPDNPELQQIALVFLTTVKDTVLLPMTSMLESQARRGEYQDKRAERAHIYFQNVIDTAISANQGAVFEHAQRIAQQSAKQRQIVGGNNSAIPAHTGTLVTFNQPIQNLSPQQIAALNTPVLPSVASLMHGTYQAPPSSFDLPPMNMNMGRQAFQPQSRPLTLTSPFNNPDQQSLALTGGNTTIQNLLTREDRQYQ